MTRRNSAATSGDARRDRIVKIVVLHQRDEGVTLQRVDEQYRLQAIGHVLGPVHRQLQRFESRTVLLAGQRTARPRRPIPLASPSSGSLSSPGSPYTGAIATPTCVELASVWRVGAEILEALTQARRVEPAPIRQLHHVLVAHQVVGMLGHGGQGRLGGPGPALGRGQVAGAENAVDPELEERPGFGDGPGQRLGIAPGKIAGVAPAGRSATTTSTSCRRSHS